MILLPISDSVLEWLTQKWQHTFDWDKNNLGKLSKHGFEPQEVEDCFKTNIVLVGQVDGNFGEIRFVAYGMVSETRFMTIVFTLREEKVRPICCRRSRDGEKKEFKRVVREI